MNNSQALGRGDAPKKTCRFKAQCRTYMSLQNLFNYHWIFLESFNSSQICRFVCFPRASEPVQICGWRVVARFHGQSHPHFSGNVLRVLEEILAAARPNCGHGCNLISQNWWKNRRLKWLKPLFCKLCELHDFHWFLVHFPLKQYEA